MKQKTIIKKPGRWLVALCVGILAFAVFLGVLFSIEIKRYEKGILDVCAVQQDGYVELVVDQINLNKKRSDTQIINDILGTLDSSGQQYWTFSKGEDILFVKNVLETNEYKGLSADTYYDSESAAEFIDSLKNSEIRHSVITVQGETYIASGEAFKYRGEEYHLVLLTDTAVILGNNTYLEARTAMTTTFLLVLAALTLIPMVLATRYRKLEKAKADADAELEGRNRALVKLNETVQRLMLWKNSNAEETENDVIYRKYELKFYLNAEHYIIIDGKKGELHPHTWEFSLDIGLPKDDFVRFDEVEKEIQGYLSQYQNQVLNDMDPFDAILPTVENLTDFFAGEFQKEIRKFNGRLYRVKGAETPTRIYVAELGETED